jgi:hypothetical protein
VSRKRPPSHPFDGEHGYREAMLGFAELLAREDEGAIAKALRDGARIGWATFRYADHYDTTKHGRSKVGVWSERRQPGDGPEGLLLDVDEQPAHVRAMIGRPVAAARSLEKYPGPSVTTTHRPRKDRGRAGSRDRAPARLPASEAGRVARLDFTSTEGGE